MRPFGKKSMLLPTNNLMQFLIVWETYSFSFSPAVPGPACFNTLLDPEALHAHVAEQNKDPGSQDVMEYVQE